MKDRDVLDHRAITMPARAMGYADAAAATFHESVRLAVSIALSAPQSVSSELHFEQRRRVLAGSFSPVRRQSRRQFSKTAANLPIGLSDASIAFLAAGNPLRTCSRELNNTAPRQPTLRYPVSYSEPE